MAPSIAFGYRPVYRPGLGIGIYIGSPYVQRYRGRYSHGPAYYPPYYPSYYPSYPSYSRYAQAYPYPAGASVYAVPPPDALYGAVRLDVTPRDAAVYVDGYYAGVVDDFDGALQHIALEPGPHHFEIVMPGYDVLAFDVNVRPNQTVRYRGDMPRIVP